MFSILKRKERPFGIRDTLTIVAGLSLYAVICALLIGRSSIWFDEAYGAYLIRFGFFDIARFTASDVHPPLYYWVLKVWSELFGTGDVALRSLSVLFGAVALVFAWLVVRRMFGRRVAAVALLFASLTPFFVRYGTEARMYTMVAAIGFAGTYALLCADRSKKTWQWIIYGVLVGLGMLTHYYILLVWLAHWVWRAVAYRHEGLKGKKFIRQFFSRGWLLAHAIGVLLFAPWIGPLYNQLRDVQTNGFWIPPITPATPIDFLSGVIFYNKLDDVRSWAAIAFGVVTVGLVAIIARAYRRLKGGRKINFGLIIMLATVPPLLLLLLSLPPLRPSFVDRYVVPSALAIGLLTGISLALARGTMKPWLWRGTFVIALIVFGYGIGNVYRFGNYNATLHESNNTRQVLEAIRTRTPNATIIANSPWLYYEAAAYTTPASPVMFIDADTAYVYGSLLMLKESDMGKIKDMSTFEADHRTFWYIGRPGEGNISLPGTNLTVIDSFRINDSVSGKPAYQAIEYRVL